MPILRLDIRGETVIYYESPSDRTIEGLVGMISRVISESYRAHRLIVDGVRYDPLQNESYLEWLNRLAGEGLLGMDFRPGVLAKSTAEELESKLLFLVAPGRISSGA
mgnify:CR=1 FL=1